MRSHHAVVAAALVALVPACSTVTAEKEAQARDLGERVASYETSQRARIDRLNRGFRQTAARLNEEYALFAGEGRSQQQYADQQRIADRLVSAWRQDTLPSRLRDLVETNVDRQLERIAASEKAIAEVRRKYAEAYRSVALELARLKKVRAGLRAIENDDATDRVLAQVFKAVGALVTQLRNESKK